MTLLGNNLKSSYHTIRAKSTSNQTTGQIFVQHTKKIWKQSVSIFFFLDRNDNDIDYCYTNNFAQHT